MEIWNQTNWWIELILNLCLYALPALAAVAVAGELGARTVIAVRKIWKLARPALDEPTDPAIIFLAGKSKKSPQVVSDFIVQIGDQIVAMMPEEAAPRGG